MKSFLQNISINILLISMILLIVSISSNANANTNEQQESQFSDAELAQMLAPIALYPDSLLTHILIASTYPLEIIEAERWLAKRESLSKSEIIEQSEALPWDASIKALISFPTIVTKLSDDLSWMQNLGDAFLQDEESVLATIQVLRQQAEDAGSLAQMDNVQIVKEKKIIIIESSEPEVIYVPYYDTRVVYGNWHWRHYPPVYWNTPRYYGYHRGPFHWDSGVHIAFDFFFSDIHWHNRHVVVDYSYPRKYHAKKRISTSHQAKRWHHKPAHRKGVAYRNNHLKSKYSSSRPVDTSTRKISASSRVKNVQPAKNEHNRPHKNVGEREHKRRYSPAKKDVREDEPRHRTFNQKLKERPITKQVKLQPKVKHNRANQIKEVGNKSMTTVVKTNKVISKNDYSTYNKVRSPKKNEAKEQKTNRQPKARTQSQTRTQIQRHSQRQNNRHVSRPRAKKHDKNRN